MTVSETIKQRFEKWADHAFAPCSPLLNTFIDRVALCNSYKRATGDDVSTAQRFKHMLIQYCVDHSLEPNPVEHRFKDRGFHILTKMKECYLDHLTLDYKEVEGAVLTVREVFYIKTLPA